MRHALSLVLSFFAAFIASATLAQSRAVTESAAPSWARFTCVRNADASVECSGCVVVTGDDGSSREECSSTFKLGAEANITRANALGDAARARALRRFGVDGGAP